MRSASMNGRMLHASLCEIERGLFHISYRIDTAEWEEPDLPLYQVDGSVVAAQQHIEQRALELGFDAIEWDYELLTTAITFPPVGRPKPH